MFHPKQFRLNMENDQCTNQSIHHSNFLCIPITNLCIPITDLYILVQYKFTNSPNTNDISCHSFFILTLAWMKQNKVCLIFNKIYSSTRGWKHVTTILTDVK